jgi:hypothetical protein
MPPSILDPRAAVRFSLLFKSDAGNTVQHGKFQIRSTNNYKTKDRFDNIYLDFFIKASYNGLKLYVARIRWRKIKMT